MQGLSHNKRLSEKIDIKKRDTKKGVNYNRCKMKKKLLPRLLFIFTVIDNNIDLSFVSENGS